MKESCFRKCLGDGNRQNSMFTFTGTGNENLRIVRGGQVNFAIINAA
ncbi:hypothetical protein [Bacillus smithii]|nr:hypothetical protein [Bacillus smithii]